MFFISHNSYNKNVNNNDKAGNPTHNGRQKKMNETELMILETAH